MNGTRDLADDRLHEQSPADEGSTQGTIDRSGQQQAPVGGSPYAQPAPAAMGQPHVRLQAHESRSKSPALACVLSAVPGLGQIYVGYYQRGFIHAIVVGLIFSFFFANKEPSGALIAPFVIFLVFFWLYNIIDAGRRASLYNHALIGSESIELPQDFSFPGVHGSIVGGIVLVAVGSILLSYTRFEISLAWLEEWWPAIGILAGFYLLFKGISERKAEQAD